MADDVAWLQIYGQAYWHRPAEICGDETALTALRDAINKALEGKEAQMLAFSSDGEGYELSVKVMSQEELEELPSHYIAHPGKTQWDDGYNYVSKQYLPMIRSLQERLHKLEGKPLRKDKLMEKAEED